MKRLILLLTTISALAACSPDPGQPLVASDIRVTAPRMAGGMSAGYFTLRNHTDATIEITRVTSPQFGRVEIHETRTEDGVSRMRPVDALTVPPGGEVRLEPGGKHLMLMQPEGPANVVTLELWSGNTLQMTLDTRVGAD